MSLHFRKTISPQVTKRYLQISLLSGSWRFSKAQTNISLNLEYPTIKKVSPYSSEHFLLPKLGSSSISWHDPPAGPPEHVSPACLLFQGLM